MIRSYFKYAFRSIKSRKLESITNVIGLSVSFAICLIITIYLVNEFTYDRFHKDSDNIYRLVWESDMIGSSLATIPELPLDELIDRYPEINDGLRLYRKSNFGFKLNDIGIIEENIFYTTDEFFDFFAVEVSHGDVDNALSEPNSIILTKKLSLKYFGSENSVGEFIQDIDGNNLKVTAVVEAFPQNSSHIEFQALVSLITLGNVRNPLSRQGYTYLKLSDTIEILDFEEKLQEITVPEFSSWFNFIRDVELSLQPITDIHLKSDLGDELKENGNSNYLLVLGIIGVILIIVASINYINLSTSRYKTRVPEIGIRKTFGADRKSIFWQFIVESVLVAVIAYFCAVVFAQLISPFFNYSFNTTISILNNPIVVLTFFFLVLTVSVLAALYPSFYLAKLSPKRVLINNNVKSRSALSINFRSISVFIQFCVVSILISISFGFDKQVRFFLQSDAGFEKTNIISINTRGFDSFSTENLRYELLNVDGILDVSFTEGTPLLHSSTVEEDSEGNSLSYNFIRADSSLVNVLDLELKYGRNFDNNYSADEKSVILNETAITSLGLSENPIGTQIDLPFEGFRIIGVVKDFSTSSFHNAIEPMFLYKQNYDKNLVNIQKVLVSLDPENQAETIENIKERWSRLTNGQPFDYDYLEETWNLSYRGDILLTNLISFLGYVIIFVSGIGLVGLAAFNTSQSRKEIAIRKSLGANIESIFFLITYKLLRPIVLGFIVSIPISYYLLSYWLRLFVYKINIDVYIFIFSLVITLTVAFSTIFYFVFRASLLNPIIDLRQES